MAHLCNVKIYLLKMVIFQFAMLGYHFIHHLFTSSLGDYIFGMITITIHELEVSINS
jgi:hypothetical protein